eukprot:7020888-Heterocapsa_arctica.AAC.1
MASGRLATTAIMGMCLQGSLASSAGGDWALCMGQWTQRIVAAKKWMKKQLSSEFILDNSSAYEDDIADELKPVVSFGMPPLQSELGQRAQRIVVMESV